MKNSMLHLVDYALARGELISVFDEAEWPVKKSANRAEIISAIESVGNPELRIRNAAGESLAWVMIVNGLEADEIVADYTDNEYMTAWSVAYQGA